MFPYLESDPSNIVTHTWHHGHSVDCGGDSVIVLKILMERMSVHQVFMAVALVEIAVMVVIMVVE